MTDKRLKDVIHTLSFLRSVIMSGEPMTNDVRNAIDDSICNLTEVDKEIEIDNLLDEYDVLSADIRHQTQFIGDNIVFDVEHFSETTAKLSVVQARIKELNDNI